MGIRFVRETDGQAQSLGSVLTNSILCCCSCFHGAPFPSLLLLPLLTACLSPHTHTQKHTFTHTQVSEIGFSYVSKSAATAARRESLILQPTLPITTVSRIYYYILKASFKKNL